MGTGSCFKTFSCSSPCLSFPPQTSSIPATSLPVTSKRQRDAFHPCLSLKAMSSHGQDDVQRQTELYGPISELKKHKVNMIVAHVELQAPHDRYCVFCWSVFHDHHPRMHALHSGSSMKNACRWDGWKCQYRDQSNQDGAEGNVGVINHAVPDGGHEETGCGWVTRWEECAWQGAVCSAIRLGE